MKVKALIPDFMRKRLQREIDALKGPGMHTNDGKIRVIASDIQRILDRLGSDDVILTEAEAAEEALNARWQSIETAPKDAIVLLGITACGNLDSPLRLVYEGRWNAYELTWTSTDGFICLESASHWQPLPTPPKEKV